MRSGGAVEMRVQGMDTEREKLRGYWNGKQQRGGWGVVAGERERREE